jgi:hypothetical protein
VDGPLDATPSPHRSPDDPSAWHEHESDRASALAWAAAFRERRAQLRAALNDGSSSLDELFARAAHSDDGAVKLLFVLESLPGAAKVATRRHLALLGIDDATPLDALTAQERDAILRDFPLAERAS